MALGQKGYRQKRIYYKVAHEENGTNSYDTNRESQQKIVPESGHVAASKENTLYLSGICRRRQHPVQHPPTTTTYRSLHLSEWARPLCRTLEPPEWLCAVLRLVRRASHQAR